MYVIIVKRYLKLKAGDNNGFQGKMLNKRTEMLFKKGYFVVL